MASPAQGFERPEKDATVSAQRSVVVSALLQAVFTAVVFAGGWVMSQTRASASSSVEQVEAAVAINANAQRIETKVSKDEFNQYVQQTMANQQQIRDELKEIRSQLQQAAQERRKGN